MTITPANRNDELGRFFKALKDRSLEPDDPVCVKGLHADAGGDPIGELARQILWNEGGGTYLFTGQRGTGKSTELRRLRRDLKALDCAVFLLDMGDYIHETEPIEIGDFLVSLMGALSDALEAGGYASPAYQSYWERFSNFMLKTEVKVEALDAKVSAKAGGVELGSAGVKLALKEDVSFKTRVQTATRDNLTALVLEARTFAQSAVAAVREKHGMDVRIVVIADSVERLRGVNAERSKQVFESAVALFSGNPDQLKFPNVHMLYSVPPYLCALTANLSALYGSQMVSLASAHVYESPTPNPTDPAKARHRQPSSRGLDALRQMILLRYAAWGEVLTSAQLDRLALSSGGDLRDFFRLVQQAIVKAASPSLNLPLPDLVLDMVEDTMRREMMPIPDDDKGWLKRIAVSHEPHLPSLDKLPTLGRFLDTRVVLNYRNGHDWYDVHPLLWEVIDSFTEPAASTLPAATPAADPT